MEPATLPSGLLSQKESRFQRRASGFATAVLNPMSCLASIAVFSFSVNIPIYAYGPVVRARRLPNDVVGPQHSSLHEILDLIFLGNQTEQPCECHVLYRYVLYRDMSSIAQAHKCATARVNKKRQRNTISIAGDR